MQRADSILVLALMVPALAQAVPAPRGQHGEPVALELKEVAELEKGQVAAVEGEVDADGLSFSLPDLSVRQPAEVWVAAPDPSRPVRLEITKFGFDGVLKQATTDESGMAVVPFRTELGVVLTVKAARSPAPFQLVAWAGEEVRSSSTAVIAPMRESREPQRRRPFGYAAIGALIAVFAVVAFARSRRS